MNPLGPPDSYLADMLMSTFAYSVSTLSALLLLGVVVYVLLLAELLRGGGPRAMPRAPGAASPPAPAGGGRVRSGTAAHAPCRP